VLSFFSFLGGGFLAGAIWYEFTKQSALPGVQKAAFIIAGVSWSALALFSLCGLIGSIARSRALVAIYATFMWIHFWFDIAVSAFFIYALFAVNSTDYLNECVAQSNGTLTQQNCADVLKYARIIYIVVIVFLSLIQLYCSIIVSRYVAQLSDEAAFKAVNHMGNSGFAHGAPASYYPHKAIPRSDPDEHHELLSQKGPYHDGAYHAQGPYNPTAPAPGSYAYTDPHNAFGAHKV
jgi:hypothetical protein